MVAFFVPSESSSSVLLSTSVARLDAALFAASLGLRVHPLEPHGKKPCLKCFSSEALTDADRIRAWARRFPGCNWGAVVGAASGDFVLDVDFRHGGESSFARLDALYGPLPCTWRVNTGDGFQLRFRHPAMPVATRKLSGFPGIEILGDGHNSVIPGSIHPNGFLYQWASDRPAPTAENLADAPAWFWENSTSFFSFGSAGASQGFPALDGGGSLTSTPETEIKILLSDPLVIARILPLLGLPASTRPGQSFCCVVHPEAHPSAAIMPPTVAGQPFCYGDFHRRDGDRRMWPLVCAFYARVTGQDLGALDRDLGKSGFYIWTIRMLRDAGVIKGAQVLAPPLPEKRLRHAPPFVREVYAGVVDLFSIRWRRERRAPSPLVWHFLSRWLKASGLDVPRNAVGKVLQWLMGVGLLRPVGKHCKTTLFLFGNALWRGRRRRSPLPVCKFQGELEQALDADAGLNIGGPQRRPILCPTCSMRGLLEAVSDCEDCLILQGQHRLLQKRRQLGILS